MEGEVGFEPTERYERSSVFKTEAINHSTTHPIVNTILKYTLTIMRQSDLLRKEKRMYFNMAGVTGFEPVISISKTDALGL